MFPSEHGHLRNGLSSRWMASIRDLIAHDGPQHGGTCEEKVNGAIAEGDVAAQHREAATSLGRTKEAKSPGL